VACDSGLGGQTTNVWYLTDSPASGSYSAPSADHATHPTVAASDPSQCSGLSPTSGCPVPDLLIGSPPTGTICHNYSTDQGSPDPCGRVLNADVTCGGTPTTTDASKGEFFTTAPLSSALTLTGKGGVTLNTQTLSGTSSSVTLCVTVYDVNSNSFKDSIAYPPSALGSLAYTLAQWPTTPTPVSFTFSFLSSGTVTVPSGDRIGLRLWSTAGAVPIETLYDGSSFPTQLELNSQ
jgi:hypothetical protein